jgi:hypothetical protein
MTPAEKSTLIKVYSNKIKRLKNKIDYTDEMRLAFKQKKVDEIIKTHKLQPIINQITEQSKKRIEIDKIIQGLNNKLYTKGISVNITNNGVTKPMLAYPLGDETNRQASKMIADKKDALDDLIDDITIKVEDIQMNYDQLNKFFQENIKKILTDI